MHDRGRYAFKLEQVKCVRKSNSFDSERTSKVRKKCERWAHRWSLLQTKSDVVCLQGFSGRDVSLIMIHEKGRGGEEIFADGGVADTVIR